jgi:hypothetical protein
MKKEKEGLQKGSVTKVLINGKVFKVPVVELDDGSLVPSIQVEMQEGGVGTRYVPGNFPWQWYNLKK